MCVWWALFASAVSVCAPFCSFSFVMTRVLLCSWANVLQIINTFTDGWWMKISIVLTGCISCRSNWNNAANCCNLWIREVAVSDSDAIMLLSGPIFFESTFPLSAASSVWKAADRRRCKWRRRRIDQQMMERPPCHSPTNLSAVLLVVRRAPHIPFS